jgi:hypothetical protein
MKSSFRIRRAIGIFFMVIIAITVFSFIVMSLWNNVLVAVVPVHALNFSQALGILVLSKILFGGFGPRGGGFRGRRWGRDMKEKWQNMTPEEKEKFKQDWRNRCNRFSTTGKESATQTSDAPEY